MTASTDVELHDRVRENLARKMPTPVWIESFEIGVDGGRVDLRGHVRTRAVKEIAERAVREVNGVAELTSHVLVDTDLEIAVGQALGNDPRTQGGFPGILVGAAFGEIYLKGDVPSVEMKRAATEIASGVSGIRVVTNLLRAPGEVIPAPAVEQAEDLRPGDQSAEFAVVADQ